MARPLVKMIAKPIDQSKGTAGVEWLLVWPADPTQSPYPRVDTRKIDRVILTDGTVLVPTRKNPQTGEREVGSHHFNVFVNVEPAPAKPADSQDDIPF